MIARSDQPLDRHTSSAARRARRGSALLEFALIAVAFYVLLAGTIEIGRMVYSMQLLQNAARVGARELAFMPLPATMTFQQALAQPDVKATIYNSALLAKDITGMSATDLQAELDGWPVVNRMLVPLMIRERVIVGGDSTELLRFPGALLGNPNYPAEPNKFIVAIPRVTERESDGTETIEWLPVLEQVVPDANPLHAPFSMASTNPNWSMRGMVALRLNYPFQATTMTAFHQVGSIGNTQVEAHDDSVTLDSDSAPQPGSDLTYVGQISTYAGKFGLGKLYVLGKEVRPFRRLLSAQSLFRREVFTK